jgi:hypothetical protein
MPSEPTPNDVKNVSLELVIDELPHRNPWRPTTLTVRKFLRICHLVEKGFAVSRACEAELITYSHFRRRVTRSLRLQERLKEAETTRFNLRHEQALESIAAAGERSWMAHAWWLERCLPNLYALRNVSRPDPDAEESVPEIPAEVLARHRALMLELAREDEARAAAKELPAVSQSAS